LISSSQLNKSSSPPVDYEEEIKRIWNRHVDSTDSQVLLKTKVSGGYKEEKEEKEEKEDVTAIVKVHTARVYTDLNYCSCKGAEIGKINIDPTAHQPGCRFYHKKKVKTTDLTIPSKILDGYSLGVAL
jgi:hypothetical protein